MVRSASFGWRIGVEAQQDVDDSGDAFEEYIVYHPKFLTWMKIHGIDTEKQYTQAELDELVARSPYAGATANEIDWHEKVKMQGRVQKWVDHSISVTINLPSDVTVEEVNRLYREAWHAGCKGCTVYLEVGHCRRLFFSLGVGRSCCSGTRLGCAGLVCSLDGFGNCPDFLNRS